MNSTKETQTSKETWKPLNLENSGMVEALKKIQDQVLQMKKDLEKQKEVLRNG